MSPLSHYFAEGRSRVYSWVQLHNLKDSTANRYCCASEKLNVQWQLSFTALFWAASCLVRPPYTYSVCVIPFSCVGSLLYASIGHLPFMVIFCRNKWPYKSFYCVVFMLNKKNGQEAIVHFWLQLRYQWFICIFYPVDKSINEKHWIASHVYWNGSCPKWARVNCKENYFPSSIHDKANMKDINF